MDSRIHQVDQKSGDFADPAVSQHGPSARSKSRTRKDQYDLKCQHARKVFSEQDMEQFRLKRRNETADTLFDVDLILGKKKSPYAVRAAGLDANGHHNGSPENELNVEM